jgi:ferredoxin
MDNRDSTMERKTKRIFFGPRKQAIPCAGGESVLEALLRAKVEIDHSCGGGASCGTCRVFVRSPENHPPLPPPEGAEAEFIADRAFAPGERLSCQLEAVEGLWIVTPTRITD